MRLIAQGRGGGGSDFCLAYY